MDRQRIDIMARDKLITIRIEGEKREAFNNLAKSHNTDTASLLYDFISGCLSGKIDIKLVTGKGNRLDKIDNQIGSGRIDKLEATTQRLDNRLGQISKKLNDWIESFSDRLTDCDRELSEKTISLEHRLNALAIQLDSQRIDSEIDSIDSKLNESIARLASCLSQRLLTLEKRLDDMEPLLKLQREASIAAPIPTGETSHDEPDQPAIGTVTPEVSPSPPSPPDAIASPIETVESGSEPGTDAIETVPGDSDSSIETVTDAIGPVPGDSSHLTNQLSEGMNAADAHRYLTSKGVKVSEKTLSDWISKIKQIPMTGKGDAVSEYLIMRDGRYYPID